MVDAALQLYINVYFLRPGLAGESCVYVESLVYMVGLRQVYYTSPAPPTLSFIRAPNEVTMVPSPMNT